MQSWPKRTLTITNNTCHIVFSMELWSTIFSCLRISEVFMVLRASHLTFAHASTNLIACNLTNVQPATPSRFSLHAFVQNQLSDDSLRCSFHADGIWRFDVLSSKAWKSMVSAQACQPAGMKLIILSMDASDIVNPFNMKSGLVNDFELLLSNILTINKKYRQYLGRGCQIYRLVIRH